MSGVDSDLQLDLAGGDGTYRRKPRLTTAERPVPAATVIVAALCTAAAVLVGTGWYATDAQQLSVRPKPLQAQPVELPNVVFDLPTDGPGFTAPLCEYRTPDRQSRAELPAAVDDAQLAGRKLVLETNRGRITVWLNGWAGECAVRSIVSEAAAQRLDGVRCRPMPQTKALRCTKSNGYVYPTQLIDLTAVAQYAQPAIDVNGVVHLVPKDVQPKPVAVGKRAGLLTVVADKDGNVGGDLVLTYADTTLPAGAFYPTVGEVDEGADLFAELSDGVTITSATVD
jgi:hypothetical protein